jgi:hypothetical protein
MLYVGLDLSRRRLDYHASLADLDPTKPVEPASQTGTGRGFRQPGVSGGKRALYHALLPATSRNR